MEADEFRVQYQKGRDPQRRVSWLAWIYQMRYDGVGCGVKAHGRDPVPRRKRRRAPVHFQRRWSEQVSREGLTVDCLARAARLGSVWVGELARSGTWRLFGRRRVRAYGPSQRRVGGDAFFFFCQTGLHGGGPPTDLMGR